MSNRVFTAADLIVSVSSLRKGDRRLLGSFSANATMDSSLFKKVIVYQYTDSATTIATNEPIALGTTTAGSIIDADISSNQSGEFIFSGLTNSQAYMISLAFEDKFLFATTLSTSKGGTPTEIQELLKKQACFLLTAGFGEEHYVINFFRQYRDQILAQTWIGNKFIKIYYRLAPHYAEIIYQNEWMRFGIRAVAYLLYFLFNYYWAIILGGIFLSVIGLRKIKIRFSLSNL
jgi:hypothetical protein